MSKPEKLMMIVDKGCFRPADNYTRDRLRSRGYATGDVVAAVITKPRNPKFNRLVHRIGQLCVANIDEFSGMDSHQCVKRLQLESGVACEEMAIKVPGLGMLMHRTPKSLSFESMDEGEYREAARGICRWIAQQYWQSMTAEQVEEMASSFVGDT